MIADFYKPFLERLNLPVPKEGNYLTSSEGGFIIPITRYGIIVRGFPFLPWNNGRRTGTTTPVKNVFSSAALQPLGTLEAPLDIDTAKQIKSPLGVTIENKLITRPECVIHVYPGLHRTLNDLAQNPAIETEVKQQFTLEYLQETLNKDGYHFWDDRTPNVGELVTYNHPSAPKELKTRSVVLDLGSMEIANTSDPSLLNKPLNEETLKQVAPYQYTIFHGLRSAFRESFITQSKTADHFYDSCAAEKARRLLHSGWENVAQYDDNDAKVEIISIAQKYEEQLKQSIEHAPLSPIIEPYRFPE